MTDSFLTGLLCDLARYEALNMALDHLPCAVALFEFKGRAIYMNPQFKRLHFGDQDVSESDVPSLEYYLGATRLRNWAVDPAEFFRGVREKLLTDGVYDGYLEVDGRIIVVHDVLVAGKYILTNQRDITEHVLREREISYRASHDFLTSLANRSSFEAKANHLIEGKAIAGGRFALLMADLDHFKSINDTYGHAAGDTVLQEMACRFRACLGRNDFVARLGGDEFVFLCNEDNAAISASALAHRLVACANLPIDFEGEPLRVGVSVGYALYPEHGQTVDLLKRCADAALYAVKHSGRGSVRCFDEAMMHPYAAAQWQTAA